ncbi:hypothetical protein HYZ78_02500 [Candidatus Microgenomates bacterium]|nr:hypothetical protein [Candidatus Microgenomates bacterium]
MSRVFKLILLVGFLVLTARLIDVSVIRGNYFKDLADLNRVREIPIHAPRGEIFDRIGNKIAENVEKKKVLVFEKGKPVTFQDSDKITDPEKEVLVSIYVRNYPEGQFAAHTVGLIGETTAEEVGKSGCPGSILTLGDTVGRTGAEKSFDCVLRGKNGSELVEVDSHGNKVRVLGRHEPQKGKDIHLSIDLGLQRSATEALAGRPGAVIVSNPRTGEVLALVSSPSFDPNRISADFELISANPNNPLFNRAIGGRYPPGSTFKIVSAAAGLETGAVDERSTFTDPGVIKIGVFEYSNWYFTQYGKLEGELGLVRAITRSTDTFFYKVGEWVGVSKLAEWARKFGFGEKTGIELSGEIDGVVPTSEWKERERGERWFLGNTYHMAIGQGDVAASPLQVNQMTSVIASGGKLCKPTVVDRGQGTGNSCKPIGISDKTVDLIKQGMIGACSTGGTAFPFFDFKVGERQVPVACKTGTAEFGDPEKRTHAWLTAFTPAYAEASAGKPADPPAGGPEIVVTALVEAGGEGSYIAAPVAKKVIEEWFKR